MINETERANRKQLRTAIVEARRTKVPLVLLGSYARGTSTRALSDIDLLVIGDQTTGTAADALHIVWLSGEQLADRVRRGDDFAQWALRFGVPLTCREAWAQLVDRLLGGAPWPSTERKLEQLARRIAVADDLVEMGDIEAAREEVGSALNLIARAVLLDAGTFPLSTPELPAQLRSNGDAGLAHGIEASRAGQVTTEEDLRGLLALIRKTAGRLTGSQGEAVAVTVPK